MRRRNRPLVRVGIALLALMLVAALVVPLAGSAFAAVEDEAPTTGDELPDATAGVVLLGTAGLRWEDLSAVATPELWALAERGAIANLVVRSVRTSACPADGWLAVSAGRRAADVPAAQTGACRLLADPVDGEVPGWSTYLEAAADADYDARLGLLGDTLTTEGVTATAVGPGAAVALAGADGTLAADYLPRPAAPEELGAATAAATAGSAIVVVDVGAVRDRGSPLVPADDPAFAGPLPEESDDPTSPADWPLAGLDRTEQVAAVEERVGAVVTALGPDATVLLGSLADSGTEPLMQVLALDGPGLEPGLLGTRSTRQPGMAQTTDVLPTVLDLLGVPAPGGLSGAPVLPAPDGRGGAARIAVLTDENRHAVAVRPLTAPFFSGLILVNLLLYAAVTVGFNRRFLDRVAAWLDRRQAGRWRRSVAADPSVALMPLRAVAVTVAAIPVASYLTNLLPWWRTGSPGLVVYTATVAIAALVSGLALARPWRHHILAPVAVVAGLTTVVLAVDVVTGARLQLGALMGIQPQVGGRFYGFNNSSFTLWATATVLLATCLAEPLVRRGRRRVAAGVVAAVGLVATALNGLPGIGADFGGPPALVPAFTLLALLTLGVRLSWRRVLAVLGVTAVITISFSVLDWLRPAADRTHLGRFIETVLDGGLVDVVLRKLGQNLSNLFGSTLTFLAIGGIALVIVVLSRPLREAARRGDRATYGWLAEGSSLHRLDADARMLRPGLVALGVALGIGFAVNDSGIVIPAIGVAMAVPLLIAVIAGWLLTLRGTLQPPAGR
ncbi:hypothetical protein V2J52_04680 [Georgenia sp. MJ173]|uniref:hypothetical protein n=1 Tax=Georgenia sunbinii TaxID=3117728 RepID=UPI002F26177D